MGQQYNALTAKHIEFIQQQKMYFVASATADSRVNLSPKGQDSLRVLNPQQVIWLNLTGSGNESAAHVQLEPRMTIMFCAFESNPLILRLYGKARVIHQRDPEWHEYLALLPKLPGARQIFELNIELVQSSCGMSVPLLQYVGERHELNDWALKQGEAGLKHYWQQKNQYSIDQLPSHIMDKNG